ncbi:MAG: isopeptide-forming domain-containing fimbrial protein [Lachnospiraceae bacterium]|nr:isopeptide-forming domain-containing fimbrial protein [Lachnospiraceae bacterium]
MKRIWKRAAALLTMLVLVLSVGTAPRVKADEASTTIAGTLKTGTVNGKANVVTNKASVKITGIPDEATDFSLTAYRVVYATYDSDSGFEWHLTEWAKKALVDGVTFSTEEEAIAALAGLTTDGTSATEQDTTIVNILAAYISQNTPASANTFASTDSPNPWTITQATESGDTGNAKIDLSVGGYLVIPSSTNMAFLNMFVSVEATGTSDDSWKLKSNGAVLKGNLLGITKGVSDGEAATTTGDPLTYTYADTVDAQIGDTVYYQITVDVPRFPYAVSTNNEVRFRVEDVIPNNIKVNRNSVTVYGEDASGTRISLTKGTDYKQVYTEKTDTSRAVLKVQFGDSYFTTFCKYDSETGTCTYPYTKVVIVYEAELLSEAEAGTAEENTATLIYEDANHAENTAEANAEVYTYGATLTKYGETEETGSVLSNATFQIFDELESAISFVTDSSTSSGDPIYRVADSTAADANKTTELVTGTNGTFTIIGLDADTTYTVKETKAPAGYSLNTNSLEVKITAEKNAQGDLTSKIDSIAASENQGSASGSLNWSTNDEPTSGLSERTWIISLDSDNTGSFGMSVTDTKIAALPATGSVGIIVFTIAGVAIMILALVLINSGKSKAKKA